MLRLVTQSFPTHCDPTDCSPPVSSVHGDSPGKNTGVGCHALLRGSSQPRDQTQTCIADKFFTVWATREAIFSSVAQSCPTLCDPMNHSTAGLPVHHQLLESTETHVHRVSDAIQPSHPLSSPSPPALGLSQHQGLFQWVSSSHQVASIGVSLQHQSFQWIFRTDFL